MADRLQILIGPVQDGPRLVTVPAALRAARNAAADLNPESLILAGEDAGFARRWSRQLASLGSAPVTYARPDGVSGLLRPGVPLLEVSAEGLADNGSLGRFLRAARAADRPARWLWRGRVLARYFPSPESYARPETDGPRLDVPAAEGEWFALADPQALARAEQALFDSLIKDTDGFIARFDRRLSLALSRLMLPTPVTPNQITTASLLLGLLGAVWLAVGSFPTQVAGSLLLWFCCILDGCDGEVARLKLLCSPSGADYDLGADHIAHLAIFVAIPFAVRTADPQAQVLWPGLLMVTGMVACMFTVWWRILRRPEESPGAARLFFERIAGRDYVYLIVVLTVLRKLHWFLWAAAFGTHLFNLALWFLLRRSEPEPPAPLAC